MADGLSPISSSRVSTGDIARHSFAIVRRGFDADEVRSYLQSGGPEHRRRSISASRSCVPPWPRPRSGRPTRWSTRPPSPPHWASTAPRSCATPTRRRPGSWSRPRRAPPPCCGRPRARSTRCRPARRRPRPSGWSRSSCWWPTPSRRRGPSGTASGPRAGPKCEEVIARAKDEGRALLEQVQEARRRVLADLATRRRALSIQIEQLRAARDEMAASVSGVRDTVDAILGSLQRTDDEAEGGGAGRPVTRPACTAPSTRPSDEAPSAGAARPSRDGGRPRGGGRVRVRGAVGR